MPIVMPTYDDVIASLLSMADQYLYDRNKDMYSHDFMVAGETCLDILERAGLMEQVNAAYYKLKDDNPE